MNAIRAKYRESWLGQPSQASKGRILLTQIAVMVLCVVVLWGARVYVQDQRDDDAAELALIELLRCEQRIEGRDELRDVLTNIFELIAEQSDGTSEFAPAAQALLDEGYPPLQLADCLRESAASLNGD